MPAPVPAEAGSANNQGRDHLTPEQAGVRIMDVIERYHAQGLGVRPATLLHDAQLTPARFRRGMEFLRDEEQGKRQLAVGYNPPGRCYFIPDSWSDLRRYAVDFRVRSWLTQVVRFDHTLEAAEMQFAPSPSPSLAVVRFALDGIRAELERIVVVP